MIRNLTILFIMTAGILACENMSPITARQHNQPIDHNDSDGRPDAPQHTANPQPDAPGKTLAIVDGRALTGQQLLPMLIEADRGQVLADLILDLQLQRALARKGMQLEPDDLTLERQRLSQTLADDPDDAARLLDQLRADAGLGPKRFAALLWRNAALRKLIQDQVQITDAALAQAFTLRYGPRYEIRLITIPTLSLANQIAQQARSGASFIDLALQHSTDRSRAQAGLLSPVSTADSTYPAALRRILPDLQPGQVSDPIILDNGYALVRLERKIDGRDVRFDDVRQQLRTDVRTRVERLRMQQLARTLLLQADVVMLDDAMNDAWQRRLRQLRNTED